MGLIPVFLVIRNEDVLIKKALDNPLERLEEITSHFELRSGVTKFGDTRALETKAGRGLPLTYLVHQACLSQ